jgi:thiamine pyrophosphokinase
LLIHAKNTNDNLTLIADGYEIFAIKNEKITLSGERGKTFSVFSFGEVATGVSIRGAKYEAEDATLTPDFPLGVSNSFTDSECEIEVKSGILLVMREI